VEVNHPNMEIMGKELKMKVIMLNFLWNKSSKTKLIHNAFF